MINNTFSISYYIRKSRARKNGKAPIYMRITIEGEVTEISTKRCIEPSRWNSNTSRVMGRSEDAKIINDYLSILHTRVLKAYNNLMLTTDVVTPKKLKDKVLGRSEVKYRLMELFEEHNDKVKKLIGKDYSKATYKKFDRIYRFTKDYLKRKYDTSDIILMDVDLEFIEGFETFLKTHRDLQHNTAMKYISIMKKIVIIAQKRGILQKDPFAEYDLNYKEKTPTHLTMKELKRIENHDLHEIERIVQVRDCFVFCCYTGLSYKDADKLTNDELFEDEDNDTWLVQRRTKTDEPARILLLPKALEIYEKYKGLNENKVLPTISNQKTNAYLKEIADLCKIKKNLTFHVARHTFATTITLGNGLSIETVQIMMGHRNRRSTEHYARITNEKLTSDMKKLKKELD